MGNDTPKKELLRTGLPGEAINHPRHYNAGAIEVIDAIEEWGLGFHAGNVVKYVARHMHKGSPVEDLQKARWYLDRLIAALGEVSPDR